MDEGLCFGEREVRRIPAAKAKDGLRAGKGCAMSKDRICKTTRQYSESPVSDDDMGKLLEIAGDYARVKDYVYARYGGIGGLAKIYPGYTVQNEMTRSGLRGELGMPSVYFYLAVFEALGDIKSQWSKTKTKVLQLVNGNENMGEEEKHYLRFLLKVNNAFEAVLNQRPLELPKEIRQQYERLAQQVDAERLNRYLRRQVRACHRKCGQGRGQDKTAEVRGFSAAERAYRYGESEGCRGIFISVKEKRQRIFIPLTDSNQYKSQLSVRLYPAEQRIEINVPIEVAVRKHEDYQNKVGISLGMYTMLTTDEGRGYGEELGKYQMEYADWIREQNSSYRRNREQNPGRKKYEAKKRRMTEQLHSYINHELNRFFDEEKPETVCLVRLPGSRGGGLNKRINNSVALWQRGYIRSRLELKCRERSVEVVEVFGKDISRECSCCGALGSRLKGTFSCAACGLSVDEKTNTARNALKRGLAGAEVRL